MRKEKNVLIPAELFGNLIKYHLFGIKDLEDTIRSGLEAKMERYEDHRLYSLSKMSPDPKEKEEARKKYLERKGILEEFRW